MGVMPSGSTLGPHPLGYHIRPVIAYYLQPQIPPPAGMMVGTATSTLE
jgi:hypothetical protein